MFIQVVFEVSVVALAFGYLVLPMTAIGVAIGSATSVYSMIDKVWSLKYLKIFLYFFCIYKESEIRDRCEGTRLDCFMGDIKIENVSFSYPNRPHVQILSGININIKSGQTIALVGPSGCGKSTIVKLLQQVYDYTGGTVCYYMPLVIY